METAQSPRVKDEPPRKRRGRPRKNRSDDETLNARRERGRKAQKLYRVRQQAVEEAKKQELSGLERTLRDVVSEFLSFTNHVVQSDWAKHDLALMDRLHQSTDHILSMVDTEASGSCSSLSALTALPDDTSSVPELEHSTLDATESAPLTGQQVTAVTETGLYYGDNSLLEVSASDSVTQPPVIGRDPGPGFPKYKTYHSTKATIPMTISPFHTFMTHAIDRPRLDNPLSLEITYLAIQKAYRLLSTATNLTSHLVSRVFGFALTQHSRQQILNYLDWFLGPGYAHIDFLATASVLKFTDAMVAQKLISSMGEEVYNADKVARLLRERIQGDACQDILDIKVDISSADTPLMGYWVQPAPVWAISPYHSNTMATIRVSKARLLQSLTTGGYCVGPGPAFLRRNFEKAIFDSKIDTFC
ncbi:uncharacterized protein E0L32_010977 [Thyridium curvatum]|uniref:BZIP transcription factor n=1 Tax=Thyridium curvatum TaxID=1093900 RepID=A0A507AF00_9PEZI|nr:uncharacterized protein E0L32_010977 [Thyridium curvatum]TPX07082.1 hypothetical protein E0L32_010977 [Thyridium curvatum]